MGLPWPLSPVGPGVRIGLTTTYRAPRDLEAAGAVDVGPVGAGERLYRWRASTR